MAETDGIRLDDNLVIGADDVVRCTHCGTAVGRRGGGFLADALRNELPPAAAGPQVRGKPELFVDRRVVLRQISCPGCYVSLLTEVVPVDEPSFRTKDV